MLLVSTSLSFAGKCKSRRDLTRAEQIASLSPGGELDLVDIDLFPGGSFVAGYDYKVEPAYTAGLYSRVDGWLIETKLTPEKNIDLDTDDVFKVTGGLRLKTQATFIRFFKDPCLAMLSKPYSPFRIPFRATTALSEKFNVSDYFLFRSSAGYIINGEILALLGSPYWGLTLTGSFYLEGFYQAHMVRMDKDHVRLKILAQRGTLVEGGAGFGPKPEFDIFKVKVLDNGLEDLADAKMIELKAGVHQGKVFLVDYVLNLRDPEVAKAYDSVLSKMKGLKSLALARPFQKVKEVEADVVLNLSPLEELYKLDYSIGRTDRIKRNLRTNAEQNAYSFGLYLGNDALGFETKRDTDTAKISLRNEEDTEKYLLKSWDHQNKGKVLFGWIQAKHEEGLRILLRGTDDDFNDLVPVNFVKHISDKKTHFNYNSLKKLTKTLRKALPHEVFQSIPWHQWHQDKKETLRNFGLRFELHMSPEGLLKSPTYTEQELKVFFKDHMLRHGLTPEDFFSQPLHEDMPTIDEQYKRSLNTMVKNLSQVLNQKIPMKKRLDFIAKLRDNILFSDTGLSFMMNLSPENLLQWYHVDLKISSNKSSIDFSYGDDSISKLYKKVLTIKAALDDEALDLIREAESISVRVE